MIALVLIGLMAVHAQEHVPMQYRRLRAAELFLLLTANAFMQMVVLGRCGSVPRGRVALGVFFFFQAEDGIRDVAVTGVQTCALPISTSMSGFGSIESKS